MKKLKSAFSATILAGALVLSAASFAQPAQAARDIAGCVDSWLWMCSVSYPGGGYLGHIIVIEEP